MTISKKFVTAEYHDGFAARKRGQASATNPYLGKDSPIGAMFFWGLGWQDALAEDVDNIKETIMSVVAPKDRSLN
tara:strand:+ start:1095 stop:1319 length:225 start_codon:yes stop_codon:yes gene_type:complete